MMRSKPWKEFTPRERLAQMRWGLFRRDAPKRLPPRRIAMQDANTGRLLQGHASQHLTPAGATRQRRAAPVAPRAGEDHP